MSDLCVIPGESLFWGPGYMLVCFLWRLPQRCLEIHCDDLCHSRQLKLNCWFFTDSCYCSGAVTVLQLVGACKPLQNIQEYFLCGSGWHGLPLLLMVPVWKEAVALRWLFYVSNLRVQICCLMAFNSASWVHSPLPCFLTKLSVSWL